jgi:hypothetical protein
VKFEIGHVLFIDIVGYSRLLITEHGSNSNLKALSAAPSVPLAEAEGKLLAVTTGEVGALVFAVAPSAGVMCNEISKALKVIPNFTSDGIHSGPVNEISDLNEQANLAGAGINIATGDGLR